MGLLRYAHQHFYPPEMKSVVWLISLVLVVAASCGRHKQVSQHEKPDKAAVHYMKLLVNEDYEAYIKGMLSCDSASEQYKRNTLVLLKQMSAELKQSGVGIQSVSCDSSDVDDDGNHARAYVGVSFSDGNSETVVMPLIWAGKRWRMY